MNDSIKREQSEFACSADRENLRPKGKKINYEDDNQWQVLPDKDFCQSLETEGAEAYEAVNTDGQRVGGAIISIDAAKNHGELSFLYVKVGVQSKGNIHFYINRLGFHAVEFFNEHHPDPHMPEQFDQEDGLFRFEKRMAD